MSRSLVTILSLIVLMISCARKTVPITDEYEKINSLLPKVDSLPLATPCDVAGPVISRAKNFVGTVLYYGHPEYHGNTGMYCILYSVPNTIDSRIYGYVCNMPDKFKQIGLEVLFSGDYYHAYKDIRHTGRDGQTLLYLRLETIRVHEGVVLPR